MLYHIVIDVMSKKQYRDIRARKQNTSERYILDIDRFPNDIDTRACAINDLTILLYSNCNIYISNYFVVYVRAD